MKKQLKRIITRWKREEKYNHLQAQDSARHFRYADAYKFHMAAFHIEKCRIGLEEALESLI